MSPVLLVGIGGFIGSVLRFKIGALFAHQLPTAHFPWATFTVNILGCLLVGIIAALLERMTSMNAELRLLLITGFLGGFTTFSAFGLETFALYNSGNLYLAVCNIVASISCGLVAVWCGMRLGLLLPT